MLKSWTDGPKFVVDTYAACPFDANVIDFVEAVVACDTAEYAVSLLKKLNDQAVNTTPVVYFFGKASDAELLCVNLNNLKIVRVSTSI